MIRVVLDAGPLGKVAHPRPNREVASWLRGLAAQGAVIMLPEIADYELRRSFLLEGLTESVARLDALKSRMLYLPLNTEVMVKAAELWAEARRRHKPTADPQALDADAILAVQALQAGAIVATDNVGHLSLFVDARHWSSISYQSEH